MQLPIISGLRELGPGPRRFLLFTSINVMAWQCLIGHVMVLFARAIAMPENWVGVLLSFMPLSMLLVAFTVPLVDWLGPRKLLFSTWLARYILVLSVFLMPWALDHSQRAGWFVLLFSTLSFCLIRALGVGAWFPWIHEVVPRERHGVYFSTEMACVQAINILLLAGVALMMRVGGEGEIDRYLIVYAVGVAAGFLSVASIRWIPGGERSMPGQRDWKSPFAAYREALDDRDFMHYALLGSLGLAAVWCLLSTFVMYLRDMVRYEDSTIMYMAAVGSLGSALTIRFWGRYADRKGSGPTMSLVLVAHSAVALGWIGLRPGGAWTPELSAGLVTLHCLFAAALWMVGSRGMLCRVRETGRVGYTNVWIICNALAMGVTPIVAGMVVRQWGMSGFHACFIVSAVMGLVCALLLQRMPQEEDKPPVANLSALLRPSLPLRTLGRIVWITLGRDESNHER